MLLTKSRQSFLTNRAEEPDMALTAAELVWCEVQLREKCRKIEPWPSFGPGRGERKGENGLALRAVAQVADATRQDALPAGPFDLSSFRRS
eukprot:s4649_g4.t1